MKSILARGFTLVELLIVIALLGVIATIVIAAINPIEQANKARDAKYTADASQMVSAIERYYASNSKFPWQVTKPALSADDEFSFTNARDETVGLCGPDASGGCTSQTGTLISTDELKSEFLTRDWIKSTNAAAATLNDQQIYVGKGTLSSSSVYACFVPKSKSAKDKAIADGRVRALTFNSSTGIPNDATCTATSVWATSGCVVCVPE